MTTEQAEFWRRWGPWRHAAPGAGTFADVMAVLRLHETFAETVAAVTPRAGPLTVLDLGSGAAQLAGPLVSALRARGHELEAYVAVDSAKGDWLVARAEAAMRQAGLGDRGRFVQHDLSTGLPAVELGPGSLLIASCWGITYLAPTPLRALIAEAQALARRRTSGATLAVNMLTAGQFDRATLTRRFVTEVVPRQVWAALRTVSAHPAHQLRLAIKALPQMRAFGDELAHCVSLMPVPEFTKLLTDCGLEPTTVDATALWGQSTTLIVPLEGAPAAAAQGAQSS